MTTNWLRTSGVSQSHASMMASRLAEFSGTDGHSFRALLCVLGVILVVGHVEIRWVTH